jgi:hypothetical protein
MPDEQKRRRDRWRGGPANVNRPLLQSLSELRVIPAGEHPKSGPQDQHAALRSRYIVISSRYIVIIRVIAS